MATSDWTREVTSDAGGRTHSRTVRITYPHYGPAYWWNMSLGTIIRATINRRRRHVVHGVVVDRVDRWWRMEEGYDHELWYVAVDDGTRDQVIGWEVPAETYEQFPLGAKVNAEVSGDGKYLYSITLAR